MPAEADDAEGWWVFDRPPTRDWLWWCGVVLGAVGLVRTIAAAGHMGAAALIVNLVFALPVGVLMAGIVGGSAREYWRARHGRE